MSKYKVTVRKELQHTFYVDVPPSTALEPWCFEELAEEKALQAAKRFSWSTEENKAEYSTDCPIKLK